MRKSTILAFLALAACSKGAPDDSGTASPVTPSPTDIVKTKSGPYRVVIDKDLDTKSLPSNADLKMVDGDLGQYAIQLCGLDFQNKLAPSRCEVFVQPDSSGLLIGYAALTQGKEVRINTVTTVNREHGGTGCLIDGVMENYDPEAPNAILNIDHDFSARIFYQAWERNPGDWLVSPVDDQMNSDAAMGVWYLKRANNKLRITQERWSYCYSDTNIYIDEVFRHAVSLVKAGT